MPDRSAFEIDKHKLDEECEGQPLLMHDCMELLSEALDKERVAKATFELAEAKTQLAVRKTPDKFFPPGQKLTEGLIDAAVKVSAAYQEAQSAYLQAQHAVDEAKTGVRASEHKKSMIEQEVVLQGRDYFSAPRVSKEVRFNGIQVTKAKKVRKEE